MANEEYLAILRQGALVWNEWQRPHWHGSLRFVADLREATLDGADLAGIFCAYADLGSASLRQANLHTAILVGAILNRATLVGANLTGAALDEAVITDANLDQVTLDRANLRHADLSDATLRRASLRQASLPYTNLTWADLREADLTGADLSGANLTRTNLTGANLTGANLTGATLDATQFHQAILDGTAVYGLSLWSITGTPAVQTNLVVTPHWNSTVMVDDLAVGQFIALLLTSAHVRTVLSPRSTNAVLIIGRFPSDRTLVRDTLAHEVRRSGLAPIILDLEQATARDVADTFTILAAVSRFAIVDLTTPTGPPLSLDAIILDVHMPVVSILQQGAAPLSLFSDLIGHAAHGRTPVGYTSAETLRPLVKPALIDRALAHEDTGRA